MWTATLRLWSLIQLSSIICWPHCFAPPLLLPRSSCQWAKPLTNLDDNNTKDIVIKRIVKKFWFSKFELESNFPTHLYCCLLIILNCNGWKFLFASRYDFSIHPIIVLLSITRGFQFLLVAIGCACSHFEVYRFWGSWVKWWCIPCC